MKKPNTEGTGDPLAGIEQFVKVHKITVDAGSAFLTERLRGQGYFCWRPDSRSRELMVCLPKSVEKIPVRSHELQSTHSEAVVPREQWDEIAIREAAIMGIKLGWKPAV